jgi:hypothetical protein
MVKQNKEDCAFLLEETNKVLNGIIIVHIKSNIGGEMPPSVLHHIGKFMECVFCLFCELTNDSQIKSGYFKKSIC